MAATPEQIWNVLADFGAITTWAGNIDHSCILNAGPDGGMLGTTRRVQIKRDTVVERITEFEAEHALAYDIEGLPKFLGKVNNRWTLRTNAGGTTEVTLTNRIDMGGHPVQNVAEHVVLRVMARQSDLMLKGLANRLENASV